MLKYAKQDKNLRAHVAFLKEMVEKFMGTFWSVKVVIYRHDSSHDTFREKDIGVFPKYFQ